jgi:LysR family transcriptional regulator, regulator for metE and metH
MVLTAAGRRVLDTARRVIGEVERAEDDLRRLAGRTDGSIRVCTECNTGYHWLGPLLASFRRKHPRVTVHVAAEATGAPVRARCSTAAATSRSLRRTSTACASLIGRW